MAITGRSAALSHVGKIRANNQDSGYAGQHLFIVADGMGGHAGGDVASAIAVTRMAEADRRYPNAEDAASALTQAMLAANAMLADTVFDHPELTGMGTTVSAVALVGNRIAMAHIGDSRVYLLRDGRLQQLSADHTFVQRLVDSGRITAEEAAVHPRRSVLMRVLGDVDASPEIDTELIEVRPGDRWLLCSDGLSSYVTDDKICAALDTPASPDQVAERLVKESLDQGAPDNVTVVILDITDDGREPHPRGTGTLEEDRPTDTRSVPRLVGSAAEPLKFEGAAPRRPLRLPALLLHPLKSTQAEDSHFEPESDEYLDELIEEHRKRHRRRRITWLVGIALIVAVIAAALTAGYQWTQTRYYVGANGHTIAIFQGVQQSIGPIRLSEVYEVTSVQLNSLSPFERQQVRETITADDLEDARTIVKRLADASRR